jgi:hypothetical protein
MRTCIFSGGDSGDTGDTAVFTAPRLVPTSETTSGNIGDKEVRREADCFYRSHRPHFQVREWGHAGTLDLLGCPHCPQLSPQKNKPGFRRQPIGTVRVPSTGLESERVLGKSHRFALDCPTRTTRLMSWSERTTAAPEWRGGVVPAKAEA